MPNLGPEYVSHPGDAALVEQGRHAALRDTPARSALPVQWPCVPPIWLPRALRQLFCSQRRWTISAVCKSGASGARVENENRETHTTQLSGGANDSTKTVTRSGRCGGFGARFLGNRGRACPGRQQRDRVDSARRSGCHGRRVCERQGAIGEL